MLSDPVHAPWSALGLTSSFIPTGNNKCGKCKGTKNNKCVHREQCPNPWSERMAIDGNVRTEKQQITSPSGASCKQMHADKSRDIEATPIMLNPLDMSIQNPTQCRAITMIRHAWLKIKEEQSSHNTALVSLQPITPLATTGNVPMTTKRQKM